MLQAAVAIACLVPLLAGGAGVLTGTEFIYRGDLSAYDIDDHFRYLSGLLLGIGLGFLSAIPDIEAKGGRMRLLAAIVFVGGLARLAGVVADGALDMGQAFPLAMELIVTPALALWQARVARRYSATVGR